MQGGIAYNRSFYFPAGRSFIMGAYKALFAGIAASAPGKDLAKSLDVPAAIADLVEAIVRLEGRKGEFFGLADAMEREVVSGSTDLAAGAPGARPAVSYRSGGRSVPLSRAASSVSELAPLSLYLKHAAVRGNVLFIEEPDAGLHPASIVILAKHIVRLVRAGLYVVLTTHSAHLLEKLGKYMLAAKLSAEERCDGLGYERDDYLGQDEVSAYALRKGPDVGIPRRRDRRGQRGGHLAGGYHKGRHGS